MKGDGRSFSPRERDSDSRPGVPIPSPLPDRLGYFWYVTNQAALMQTSCSALCLSRRKPSQPVLPSSGITHHRAHTAGNLGITAEGTVRPVRKIELIANQENLFQVYFFELVGITITHPRALARAFRNRAGNYLLVLTIDYERLDFVLLEKYLPVRGGNGSGLGQKQVGIRPHVLTVERRKPSRVHRRLTWTESDPFAQYDKLLSADAVTDWSEELFRSRALFSDYYLLERLPTFSAWTEDPKPSYLRLRELYQGQPRDSPARKRGTCARSSWSQSCKSWGSRPCGPRSQQPAWPRRTIGLCRRTTSHLR